MHGRKSFDHLSENIGAFSEDLFCGYWQFYCSSHVYWRNVFGRQSHKLIVTPFKRRLIKIMENKTSWTPRSGLKSSHRNVQIDRPRPEGILLRGETNNCRWTTLIMKRCNIKKQILFQDYWDRIIKYYQNMCLFLLFSVCYLYGRSHSLIVMPFVSCLMPLIFWAHSPFLVSGARSNAFEGILLPFWFIFRIIFPINQLNRN